MQLVKQKLVYACRAGERVVQYMYAFQSYMP